MPDLDTEVTKSMTAMAEIRNVQLNEKISETEYQILHPETKADQVITNTLKRFVSDEEKANWNKSYLDNINSLHYRGAWTNGAYYKKHDVVYTTISIKPDSNLSTTENEDVVMFFICIEESGNDNGVQANAGNKPTLNLNNPSIITPSTVGDLWVNIDFRSYLASRTQTVRVANSNDYNFNGDSLITFVKKSGEGYRTIGIDDDFKYNPSTNTFTVVNIKATTVEANSFIGDLDGTAKNAINYVAYPRDTDGNKIEGETSSIEIDETIVGLKKAISEITGGSGGVILGNKLTVTKDGKNPVTYDGSIATTIDIKQSYTPEEINDLLDGTNKIKNKWLPDSVLGQLEYRGTWDPAPKHLIIDTSRQVKGYYFIAEGNGNYNPDGSLAAASGDANPTFYLTGDWAVYNGEGWDKVDNTDAVTMVNGQIGSVQTYKTWSLNKQYYRGDIVRSQGLLYICNTDHISSTVYPDTNLWDLFGRSYEATDGIKIENDSIIKHDTAKPVTTNKDITLNKEQKIPVPVITVDNFGHVSNIDINNITLGPDFIDTVREVKVKGETVLANTDRSTALDFRGTTWIEPVFENNQLYFNHKDNGITGAMDLTVGKVTTTVEGEDVLFAGQGYSVPSFSIDAAGHVVSAGIKTFKISDNIFKHSHFNITKDSSGSLVIGAYAASVANSTWVSDSANILKFYLGSVNPKEDISTQMNFNGVLNAVRFMQLGNDVLDTRTRIYNGKNIITNTDLYGTYDATNKAMVAPDSGIVAGVYSAIAFNSKGIACAGGHIVEFGKTKNADPSDSLAIGGLFFRWMDTGDANA